ncbi:PREDICTED: uncharacterized protein LOC106819471 [Priapulus caudatus]|uniref:Uncharacterized protein LOC106819471 n=1 Tax=Priapulus caudatus TaxID=37621 RepID=A0ABM1F563_PRICU|nr:PREDICTED: uncharacterized protein LOC106819471 [Priapulus caudatus]
MALSRLPVPEPPIFFGDPLRFPDWLSSFSSLIESNNLPPGERIHYLKRYLGGPAREAVSGFFLLRSEHAYQKAKETLQTRFGNPFAVSEAFRTKLDSWPRIGNRDGGSLRNLSDFLRQCVVASAEIRDLEILNDMREIRKIGDKLPDWLQHRWYRSIVRTKRERGRYPSFEEFVDFVSEEADILNDPIVVSVDSNRKPKDFSQISATRTKKPFEPRRMVMTTESTAATSTTGITCIFCKRRSHATSECRAFGRKPMSEQQDFVKGERLCFGCLQRGHMSRNCPRKRECNRCSRKHPTSLHDDTRLHSSSDKTENRAEPPKAKNRNPAEPPRTNDLTSNEPSANGTSHEVSSCSDQAITSMVVPVYVSSREAPDKEVLVYALLDTMSDTTFVLDSIADELHTSSESAVLRLTTMSDQNSIIRCRRYNNLTVRSCNSRDKIPLPSTFTRDYIPLERDHIPTPEVARQWPHLHHIAELLTPKQTCPIRLLIGYNCSRALAPVTCITGKNGQPYAVETVLGWSVVGGTRPRATEEAFDAFGQSHRAHTRVVQDNVGHIEKTNVTYVSKNEVRSHNRGTSATYGERL